MTKTDRFVKKLIAMTLSKEIEWDSSHTGISYFWKTSLPNKDPSRVIQVQESRFDNGTVGVNKTLMGGPNGESGSAEFGDSEYDLDLVEAINKSNPCPDWADEFIEKVLRDH